MRFIVYGAGGIGGVLGARLSQHGHDIALIARGAHLEAIRTKGLRVEDPDGSEVVSLPAAGDPSELNMGDGDVVLLAMKTQDTDCRAGGARRVAPPTTPVVCVQNGVENERLALRRFERVYGVSVMCPTSFLEPGVVQAFSSPSAGMLDTGCYPDGVDELAEAVAAAFTESTFPSEARPDIMRWKYRKLVLNLGNAIEAVCGPDARGGPLLAMVTAEGEACLDAAGIDRVTAEDDVARRGDLLSLHRIGGQRRGGGSSWQSLTRGTGRIETDHLNGEIVLLGRLHGVATPANELLRRLANRLAREGKPPGSFSADEVLSQLK